MSKVLVSNLNVRAEPSINSEVLDHYDKNQMINSGESLIENEGRIWLKYTGGSGKKRYVCAYDKDGTKFVDVPSNIPGPRPGKASKSNNSSLTNSGTGISGIPKQSQFDDDRIKKWGCCFLCTCVKGGLTTKEECMKCFNWGLNSGKLRSSDCFVNCNKEDWAKEISETYGTTYHSDYTFNKNSHHFWLTQNNVEIFNSAGLGWRGKTD